MIAFRFLLRPTAEIVPWGGLEDPNLTWFGLTDGWYWIEVDGHELLRYTDRSHDQFRSWSRTELPYVDYQVVRLWQDVITMLSSTLEAVPADLIPFMTSYFDAWLPAESDAAQEAAYWHGQRCLDLAYLRDPPSIRCWRHVSDGTDTVTLDWLHRTDSDIEFTAPVSGQVTQPTAVLVDAVRDFDRRFITAMAHRVAEIERDGPPPGVRIDIDHLRAAQQDRATWLDRALATPRHTAWDTIRLGAGQLLPPTTSAHKKQTDH